jgi:hypothetical protein
VLTQPQGQLQTAQEHKEYTQIPVEGTNENMQKRGNKTTSKNNSINNIIVKEKFVKWSLP